MLKNRPHARKLTLALMFRPLLQLLKMHAQQVTFAQGPVIVLQRSAEVEITAQPQVWTRRQSARKVAIAQVSMPNAGIVVVINTAPKGVHTPEALAHLAKLVQEPLVISNAVAAVF